MDYQATIGIEIHVELRTASKMFCSCAADFFGRDPNTQVCPVCMGYPGVLPTINARTVEFAVRVGLALHSDIAPFAKFDRKNYHYPDLPKGYQISQYDLPICVNGWLDVPVNGQVRRIGIVRAHLEEDTAKTFHIGTASLVDFNRSGVPLLEIVTRPDIHTSEEARQFLIQLRTILRYLGVSTADMEKGAMRCEPNVSVSPVGSNKLGVKTEIKNLNSFRAVKQAIDYEIARQTQVLESGGRVQQVTMGWDEARNCTVFQRSKEGAEDYRYFPEPDLPPLALSAEYVADVRAHMPDLPDAKQVRLIAQYGLRPQDAQVLVQDADTADYFETCARLAAAQGIEAQTACNWITGELFRLLNESNMSITQTCITPMALTGLLVQVQRGAINANTAKTVLIEMFSSSQSAEAIIAARGLAQISSDADIEPLVNQVIQDNPDAVDQYLQGKETVKGFLVGQVMRASRGRANPQRVNEWMQARLDALRQERT